MNFELALLTEEEQQQQQQIGYKNEINRKIKNAISRNTEGEEEKEEEEWVFGYYTEMAVQHGDDDEDLQLQACNCKYCGDYIASYAKPYYKPNILCSCPETYISYYHRLRGELEDAPVIISGYSPYGNYLISYTENAPEYYRYDNYIAKHVRKMKELNAQFYDFHTNDDENRNTDFYRHLCIQVNG